MIDFLRFREVTGGEGNMAPVTLLPIITANWSVYDP